MKDQALTQNALKILQARYLLKDQYGKVTESPDGMFRRVAREIANVEERYGAGRSERDALEERFYQAMSSLDFLPNSPTLMNAGTDVGQLSACFVLPVGDSIGEIFDAVKYMAVINKSGGGTGFSFSNIRPKGDIVSTTSGLASGPVSFMRVFDQATEVIKQGGKRRGANMGILRVDHPDIREFVSAKLEEGAFSNFNLSVGLTERFMKALAKRDSYPLVNPRTGRIVGKAPAGDIFELIAGAAWQAGEPGIVFLDRINRYNPTPLAGKMESTNPCGEQPLLPFESCNLGSINLENMVIGKVLDWEKLRVLTRLAVRFLDDVIDANRFPLGMVAEATLANRKIGLGVMGFANMLIKLKIPYDSEEAIKTGGRLMGFILKEARQKSAELAQKKGPFPNFKGSLWERKGYAPLRNATLSTIAPTGTISLIAGTSSGIEPLFGLVFNRRALEEVLLFEANACLEEDLERLNFYSPDLIAGIAQTGTLAGIEGIPKDLKALYRTAFEISPEIHVRMQAAFQKHTDNAVAKTVNLSAGASIEDVKKVFLLAESLGCKGITVYRYGSRPGQPLSFDDMSGDPDDGEEESGCPGRACLY